MYFVCMLNHAQRKHKQCKAQVGVKVGKRYKAEAYFETPEPIQRLDRCAESFNPKLSRSEVMVMAVLQFLERSCPESAR